MKVRSALAALLLGTAAGVVLLPVPPAHAATSEKASTKKVLVGELKGAKPQSARDSLVQGFESEGGVEVVGGSKPAIKQGASEAEIAAAAAEAGADAVVLGTTKLHPKKGWSAEVVVHNGEDGAVIEQFSIEGGAWEKYRANLADASQFMGAVAKARLAPEPEPEPEPEPQELEEEEKEPEPKPVAKTKESSGRPSPLYARVGARLYSRSFRYTDTMNDLFPNQGYPELLTYNLAAAPMVFGRLDWYPLAHSQGGFPANVGISGGYELGVATKVQFRDETLEQSHSLWYVGPKFRLPVAEHEIGLFGAFGSHSFEVIGDEAANGGRAAFPDVNYRFIDVGADARFLFDQVRLGAHAKYRMLLGYGDIAADDWFPNTTGRALSVGGEVGWKLSSVLELLVGVDVLQYGLAFKPALDAAEDRIAGGATDRFVSVWGALGVTWPGDEPAAASISTSSEGGDKDDDFDDFD
jgi:hypothetical protein